MGAKPKWENKYERILSENPTSEKIKELKEEIKNMQSGKVTGTFKSKEEYEKALATRDKRIVELEKKLQEYKCFIKNKDKIANILAYRDSLEEKLSKLPKDTSSKVATKKQEIGNTGKKIDSYFKKIEQTKKDLKDLLDRKKSGKVENSEALENFYRSTISTFEDAVSKLQDKQSTLYTELTELEGQGAEFKEESGNKRTFLERKIAKCNLLAANLLKGKNIEDIEIKVEEGRFTSKDGKLKQKIQAEKNGKQSNKKEGQTEKAGTKAGTDLPAKPTKFEQKHPVMAKFKNNVKKLFENIKNKFTKSKTQPEKQEAILEKEEEKENELLKEIAEKGAKAVFREQLLANRKAAENRDAQKYGGIYNRQNTNTTPQHSHDEEGEEIGD